MSFSFWRVPQRRKYNFSSQCYQPHACTRKRDGSSNLETMIKKNTLRLNMSLPEVYFGLYTYRSYKHQVIVAYIVVFAGNEHLVQIVRSSVQCFIAGLPQSMSFLYPLLKAFSNLKTNPQSKAFLMEHVLHIKCQKHWWQIHENYCRHKTAFLNSFT